MSFDCATGLELELLLPEGEDRLELATELAEGLGADVELFEQYSKVPVPAADPSLGPERAANAVVATIEDVARHHGARVVSVAPDGSAFFLGHRAARLSVSGRPLLSLLHENSLAGGERVAELVTVPFLRPGLGLVEAIVGWLAAREGLSLPEGAALHVHAERDALDAGALVRLVRLYSALESGLRVLLETSAMMRSARALPAGLEPALYALGASAEMPALEQVLARFIFDKSHGLNLYNLVSGDPDKPTVELKLARASLDPLRVRAAREWMVGLIARAKDPAAPWPEADLDASGVAAYLGAAT